MWNNFLHSTKVTIPRTRLGNLLVFLAIIGSPVHAQPDAPEKNRILVIHSYHEGLKWTDGESRGIKSVLLDRDDISLSFEYMDSKRIPYKAIAGSFTNYLSEKYASSDPFDAVIVSDNNALQFMADYRDTLFPDMPVIFCGVNDYTPDMLYPFNGLATGVTQHLNPEGTIELIQLLQPDLQSLVVVCGTTPTSKAILNQVQDAVNELDEDLSIRYMTGLKTDDLLEKVAALSPADAVLLLNYNRDAEGKYYSHEKSAEMIAEASNAPVYAMEDNYLGTGVVGGYMNSAFSQGRSAAELCLQFLDTNSIPEVITDGPSPIMFDYDVMARFNLNHRLLPESAIIFHLPRTFYEENKVLIWNLVIAFTLLVLGLIGTSFGLIRSRQTEKQLRDKVEENLRVNRMLKSSEGHMRTLVEAIPDLVWLKDPNGVYLTCNQRFERFLNTSKENIIGKTDYDLLDKHQADFFRANDLAAIKAGQPRINEESVTYADDGHLEHLETIKTPMRDTDGNLLGVLGIGRDITERKVNESKLKQRVDTLTQPVSEMESVTFGDLFDLSVIQTLQDQFAEATGVASVITTPDGTPITKPSNFCRLCNIIRGTELGCQNCHKSDALIGQYGGEGPRVQSCLSGGLWDAGAGIAVGGKHVANWLIGQVRDSTQSEEIIRKYARKIGADEEEAAKAFNEVPSMPRDQFEQVAKVLYTMANQLSDIAYQNIQQARHITERQRAENALRVSEENLRTTLDSIADAVISTDIDGHITRMNPIARSLTGWHLEDAFGKSLVEVFKTIDLKSREPIIESWERVLQAGEPFEAVSDTVLVSRDGIEHRIASTASPIRTEDGNITGLVLVFRDITEEFALQEQLRQSQKMDAIGHLAGGIAHDFNNMVNGIIGGTALLEKRNPFDEKSKRLVRLIQDSAERAASLTSKLLSFARRQPVASTAVNVHSIIEDTIAILNQTIDKRIEITRDLSSKSASVIGDDAQLESVFLNLGINASHAMPEGGSLLYKTRFVEISKDECQASAFDMAPGSFIEIQVQDTGQGIEAEHLSKIFEPFFTTKEMGQGTGLGLAAAHGTVNQHRGSITVSSEVGKGTVFNILLPLSDTNSVSFSPEAESQEGSGHILLIDDESAMRITGSGLLENLGYSVETAENGAFGLEIFKDNPGSFDMVLLDMVMPIMSGKKCFEEMKKIDPNVRVVLSSGFTREEDIEEMKQNGLCGFIKKPFNEQQLSEIVYAAIHADPESV